MATFDPTTLVSTTLEDAFLEVATLLQLAEQDVTANPTEINGLQVTYDTNAKQVSIAGTYDTVMSLDPATGRPQFTIAEFLV